MVVSFGAPNHPESNQGNQKPNELKLRKPKSSQEANIKPRRLLIRLPLKAFGYSDQGCATGVIGMAQETKADAFKI